MQVAILGIEKEERHQNLIQYHLNMILLFTKYISRSLIYKVNLLISCTVFQMKLYCVDQLEASTFPLHPPPS